MDKINSLFSPILHKGIYNTEFAQARTLVPPLMCLHHLGAEFPQARTLVPLM